MASPNTKENAIKHLDAQISEAEKLAGKVGYNTYFFIEAARASKAALESSGKQEDIDKAMLLKFTPEAYKVNSEAASGVKPPTAPLVKPVA